MHCIETLAYKSHRRVAHKSLPHVKKKPSLSCVRPHLQTRCPRYLLGDEQEKIEDENEKQESDRQSRVKKKKGTIKRQLREKRGG